MNDDISSPAEATVPEMVGPYRLLAQIGRGGMGRVYLAEHETADFRRRVAVKLIAAPASGERPPEETPESSRRSPVRRFRDEVRILASLEHPGIARFLDGGRSPEGIWYLAMELVEGHDLLTHATQNDLDVHARVRLMAEVADAVAYAHDKDVVHRDLKPGNILVGHDGRPRLLDFGISKLLTKGDAESIATTRDGGSPHTPAYASPEQLLGHSATSASDVYSLGVLLYELLTGQRPTVGPSCEPPSAAARRRSGPRRAFGRPEGPRGRISRELDSVCLEALRVDPNKRYANAAALGADLRAYLAGKPPAVAGIERGRLGRWVPRRRPLLVATLLAVGIVAAVSYLGVSRSENPAVVPSLEGGLFPYDPINPPAIEEAERDFESAPDDVVAGTALALGLERAGRGEEASVVIGRLRQIPGKETDPLVDYAEGKIALRRGEHQRALVFLTRARDHSISQGRGELLGTIRSDRGSVLALLGRHDAARHELEASRVDCERSGDHRTLYRTLNDLAIQYLQAGEMDRGEATLESAVAAARSAGLEPLVALSNLAAARLARGRPDLAEPLAREILEIRRRHPNRNPVREGESLTNLAGILRELGRVDEAAQLLDQAIAVLRGTRGHASLANALYARGVGDLDGGRLERIDAMVAELMEAAQKSLLRRPLGYASSLRGRLAAARGDLEGARRDLAEAGRLLRAEGDAELAALSDLAWAELEISAGETEAASAVLDEATSSLGQGSATLPTVLAELLRVRIELDRAGTAAARHRLDRLDPGLHRAPSMSLRLRYLAIRARVAAAEGRSAAAHADLETAADLARSSGLAPTELELRREMTRLKERGLGAAKEPARLPQTATADSATNTSDESTLSVVSAQPP